jgi:hypothetical protein
MIVQSAIAAGTQLTPTITMTPKRALRFSAAFTLFGAAMHYLISGRKEANLNKMVTGAVLVMASLLLL